MRLARFAIVLFVLCASACGGRVDTATPSITFTTVPIAAAGGAGTLAPIAGRVTRARSGQKIVLFAKSDLWWVQPLTVEPFTSIERNGTWTNTIHLGTDYAALLVEPGYEPPDTTQSLPQVGNGVIAVATVKGRGDVAAPTRKILTFSGYEWEVRDVPSERGGANDYAAANAWTDAEGLMHLALRQAEGRWTSAEVILSRSLGYGTYVFTVRDTSGLDPAAAFGMLTWDGEAVAQNHRELDIEISQWGDSRIPNAQYVLQPYYVPANVARFSAPPGTLTHSFRWEPGRASFRTVRGARATGRSIVAEHEFTSGVPAPGAERVRMNLYFFRYSPTSLQRDVEVVIERFQYLP